MEKILTLNEAARLLKVAPITLYRRARKGEVPAARIGKIWRFHRDQLEEWIQGVASRPVEFVSKPDLFRHLSSREAKAVTRFVEWLKSRYPVQLRKVILYGSRARGDFKEFSDIDLLIIFRKDSIQKELQEMTHRFNLEEGVMLQPMVLSEEEWEKPSFRSFLLVERIRREGIPLHG